VAAAAAVSPELGLRGPRWTTCAQVTRLEAELADRKPASS